MRGQMLLIVVLVMVVILTVSLSVASRTITNIRVSTDEEDSERAFSAAEAGLEEALSKDLDTTNLNFSKDLDNTSSYKTNLIKQTTTSYLLNNSLPVLKDDSIDVMLADYSTYANQYSGNLTILWGSAGAACSAAALDIVILSGSVDSPTARHVALDPCNPRNAISHLNSVTGGSGTVSGKTFPYVTTITITSGLLARITPLYAATPIAVRACGTCGDLPAQGIFIESTGKSDNAQRKIVTYRTFPKIPAEIFPYVIFVPK